ncbi:YgjP-like metallopeptidase domain-containing protein [Bacillus cereus group sp. BfR-BA-01330]|uniref:YgjP-like metallopeptidase domain-containing protein n=1 Tax=Bacillus cereus group sp. BfR-BA-01330 TaxID=2920306 RepID=UPI00351DA137
MLLMFIVGYILVHELEHLKYMSPSNNHWKFASSILLDYEQHKKWLRRNILKLSL